MDTPRRYERSNVARMAYGACASDGRSADAWTERAPILRGTEGVKRTVGPVVVRLVTHFFPTQHPTRALYL